jgi:type I restriction enzyme S subunit
VPYIRITDIDESGRFRPSPKVEVRHPDADLYRLAPGQIVLARTGASVGKSYRYNPADGPLVFAGFLINIAPDPTVLNPGYLAAYLRTSTYWNWVATTSVRSGQPGINSREYAAMPIPVPPIAVQNSVADALADCDAHIEEIEALISKKTAESLGIAEALLSGRIWLPGGGEQRVAVRLGAAGSAYGGLSGKSKDDFGIGSGRYVTFLEVINNVRLRGDSLERVRVDSGERQNQVARGDVLFNGSSETPEEVALSAVVDFDPPPGIYLNSFCFGFRLIRQDLIDPTYLAYLFRSSAGRRLVWTLAQGATRYNIGKRKVLALAPEFPPIEDQRAIAAVAREADQEIEALRRRLSKAKAIQQGMAQQLLSGRTRLRSVEAIA